MSGSVTNALQTTLGDIVRELESRGWRYALIGGLATSLHGRVRVTDDIDLVIQCDVDQALDLVQTVDPTRFAPLFPDVAEVIRTAFLVPLLHQQTGIQLDLAVGVSGFEQQIVSRATRMQLAKQELYVATAEDLLLMKVLAGRPQDDQDVRGILDVQGKAIDWDYCIAIADQLQEAVGIDVAARVRKLRDNVR
jgi:predicted nucleotidyltransferase